MDHISVQLIRFPCNCKHDYDFVVNITYCVDHILMQCVFLELMQVCKEMAEWT